MEIVWSRGALSDFAELRAYIAEDSQRAADELIASHPSSGSQVGFRIPENSQCPGHLMWFRVASSVDASRSSASIMAPGAGRRGSRVLLRLWAWVFIKGAPERRGGMWDV
jgi:hypothetical protein